MCAVAPTRVAPRPMPSVDLIRGASVPEAFRTCNFLVRRIDERWVMTGEDEA